MSDETSADKFSHRWFPVLLGDQRSIWQGVPDSIPWEVISSHEQQARANHGRPLEVLAEQGGLSPYELVAVLLDQPFWRCMLPEPATITRILTEKMGGLKVD